MNMMSTTALDALVQKVRGGIASGAAAPAIARSPEPPRVSDYPEHALLERLRGLYESGSDLRNPYFLPRSGEVSGAVRVGGRDYITFSNYNYLGLSNDPRVKQAVHDAVERYGCHAGAARMVGGEIELHAQLEAELAEFTGFEAVTVGVGGYSANVSAVGYLLDKRDVIFHDAYMHNSGVMGAVMSGARRIAFPHDDMDALESLLEQHRGQYRRAILLVEGAYSMDGDLVDLPRIIELKRRFGAWLMIDEAHSCGTVGQTGRGVCEHFDIPTSDVDLIVGTLSKSFASCGGFLAGRKDIIELLKHFCPGLLLYSTGISPANTAAALAALRLMRDEPQRVRRLQHNARVFKGMAQDAGLDCRTSLPGVPIVPLMIEDEQALSLMSHLLDHGVIAHAVMHPVVPRDAARLRCFISAEHDEAMIRHAIGLMAAHVRGA
jgi:8-amino-7-oxononanoate synthase